MRQEKNKPLFDSSSGFDEEYVQERERNIESDIVTSLEIVVFDLGNVSRFYSSKIHIDLHKL